MNQPPTNNVVNSLGSIYENSSMTLYGNISVCIWFVILCALVSSGNSETVWTVREGALNSSCNFDISNFGYFVMNGE